jgi:hypothetical protein
MKAAILVALAESLCRKFVMPNSEVLSFSVKILQMADMKKKAAFACKSR